MTDHSAVPTMANGDWVDGAWLNQYLRDNFAAIFQAYLHAGSLAYALDANTIAELVKPAVDSYLKMKSTGEPEYVPVQDVGVPTGAILPFGGGIVPGGFLLCDWAAYSRTTYARLYAVVGTTWGVGDGINTFNVPDGRGRSFIGAGQGSGLTNRTLGETLGEESHTMTLAELVIHHHVYKRRYTVQNVDSGVQGAIHSAFEEDTNTTDVGGGDPFNIMQPVFVGNWIIKD